MRFANIKGHRYKRVIAADSFVAANIERSLEQFERTSYFPPLVMRYENEVWLEFVEGERPRPEPDFVDRLADFYATLYRQAPREQAVEDTPFARYLQRDLRFLEQAGVLESEAYQDLAATAERLTPERVWVGFDYMDPVLKNFVIRRDGSLCAIDVESVFDGNLIGAGLAKARIHWLDEPSLASMRKRLAGQADVPDFFSYFSFVELQFLARWTKIKVLTAKRKFVDAGRFERFREPAAAVN